MLEFFIKKEKVLALHEASYERERGREERNLTV